MQEHSAKELLPHLFRQEYAKMTAVLCRHFGLNHIEIAEDIASDTFLKASEHWAVNGIPENPAAWLYTVARNKTKDYIKRLTVFETQIKNKITTDNIQNEESFDFSSKIVADSQLSMIFAVCNPSNSTEAQICLALQILCGFSVQEIANAFLTKQETIKKRLYRARTNLRNNHFQIRTLTATEIKPRLATVLKTIYLLFNEGYFSKTNDLLIRKDLCSEALRLILILTENEFTNTPQTNALLALMCYQSSRLDARANEKGEVILFEEQDKSLWDQALIDKGNYYLINACTGNEISKYHLEAGIAYWHTTADEHKWQHILQLYDQLVRIEDSPTAILNSLFAYAKVYGHEEAISKAEKSALQESNYYYELLGYLYSSSNIDKAIYCYEKAVTLATSKTAKQTLRKEIAQLRDKKR